jgi:hypothetical protein
MVVMSFVAGVGVVSPVPIGAVSSSEGAQIASARVATTPFNAKILSARAAMTTALTHLTNHRYPEAVAALRTLRLQMANAHAATMTLMGPGRVLSMLNLEHQVAMRLLAPINALTDSTVANALQTRLWNTFAQRTWLLNKVIALPQDEGVGADYDDSESDTLPIYTAEVDAYVAALGQFQLTAEARTALTQDLAKVRATRTQFTGRFGGGE